MNIINICIMISGNGSNMLSLIGELKKELYLEFPLIISDNLSSVGLQKARELGFRGKILDKKSYKNNSVEFEKSVDKLLLQHNVHLICLAGFMRVLSPWFVEKWKWRILNIHPSILPKFKGLNTHSRVLKTDDKIHGCTVHYVNEQLDAGEILGQAFVTIELDDTPATLSNKVLKEEHRLYPKVVRNLVNKNNQFLARKTIK